MNYMTVHVCVCAVHVLKHVRVACDAWGVPRGCLNVCIVCVWHGIEAQNGQSLQNTQTLTKTW